MELRLTPTERRLAVVGALLSGVVHILLPELLIDLARFGYDAVLDVSFVSRDETAQRVRLLGVVSVLFAAAIQVVPLVPEEP
jgi:hypothetical protein